MHSHTPHHPKLHFNTLLQGGLETQEDPVITYKDLVIIPSASSYLDHFLNNFTFKPFVAHRQAVLLIKYSLKNESGECL